MGIEFFDMVYVLNLPERTDRLELISAELKQNNIGAMVIESVKCDPGFHGLLQTMRKLFRQALLDGHKNILVLEDDVKFLAPVQPFLEKVIPQLPKKYHCFHLGLNLLSIPTRISENILRISSAYSTHAVAYSREGMELIFPLLNSPAPYDILLMQKIQPYGHSYCTFPQLATQRPGHSDIEGKFINWDSYISTSFTMFTRNLNQMPDKIPCSEGHTWEGIRPLINPEIMQPQFPQFWGKVCDCGRMKIIAESECGCFIKQWEIQIIPV